MTLFFTIVVNAAIELQTTPPEMRDLGHLLSASRTTAEKLRCLRYNKA
ncbi:MAG: hypothetical protein AB7K36_10025 [Chloroflexota bacterium]